jgi:hypothetical protein
MEKEIKTQSQQRVDDDPVTFHFSEALEQVWADMQELDRHKIASLLDSVEETIKRVPMAQFEQDVWLQVLNHFSMMKDAMTICRCAEEGTGPEDGQ